LARLFTHGGAAASSLFKHIHCTSKRLLALATLDMPHDSVLDAEPPPEYTPAPDVWRGESTVEFGPNRAFQRAPAPLQSLSSQVTGTGDVQYVSPTPTGGFPYGSPTPPHLNAQATGVSTRANARPPPPRHPSLASHSLTPPSMPPRPRPMSDFAADFYNAGVGESSQAREEAQIQHTYTPPPGLPPASNFSAPVPQHPEVDGGIARGGTSPTQSRGAVGNEILDDGKPTHTPVPGHPLLKDGHILIYPAGFECHKCKSTSDSC
jgi:hypothetical protein